MNYKAICLTISLLAAAAPATALELCGDFNQGEIIIGKTEDEASTVTFNQKQYPITEDGYFHTLTTLPYSTNSRLKPINGTFSALTAFRSKK